METGIDCDLEHADLSVSKIQPCTDESSSLMNILKSCFNQDQAVECSSLLTALKTCAREKDICRGSILHDDIVKRAVFRNNIHVACTLIHMYAKCGVLAKAQQVFDGLPARNVTSWNALIAGYAQNCHGKKALECFQKMQQEGFSANSVTYVCALKACGSIGLIDKGKELHYEIMREGLLKENIVVGTAMVDMYAKCGALASAQQVFDELPGRNLVSWNVLITGYLQHGLCKEAVKCLGRMQQEGIKPNGITYAQIVKTCTNLCEVDECQKVHAEMIKDGLLQMNLMLANSVVHMYAKCRMSEKAQEVFDELPVRDIVSWTTLVQVYADHGRGDEAIRCFEHMQSEGLSPNSLTYVCTLKACGAIGQIEKGRAIHDELDTKELMKDNHLIGTALVDMYAKCGELAQAQQIFDELLVRDSVAWAALIAGYAQHGHGQEALSCYEGMLRDGFVPDEVSFVCILKACGSMRAADKGEKVHIEIIRGSLLGKNIVLGNALVDMYAKCGLLSKAQEVFEQLPIRDLVAWTSLITGYADYKQGQEALNCFDQLHYEGLSPNEVTFVCALRACGSIGTVGKARDLHAMIRRDGLLKEGLLLGTALVDVYVKCGILVNAQGVFDDLPVRDVATWNVLIAGYTGKSDSVFKSLENMIGQGVDPNDGTFTLVLNACSHLGLLDKGQFYFDSMTTEYGIKPTPDHYRCMVDLYCRAGHFDKAIAVIKKMSIPAGLGIWHVLLAACQKWGNVELGRFAFEHAVQLDEEDASLYVCMGNIFATAGMQDDAEKMQKMFAKKERSSWANINETLPSLRELDAWTYCSSLQEYG